jgi:hypothetical protein
LIYFIFFLNATLDYAKEDGYIITLHSKKFVPRHYGRIRSYFRYINNRGLFKNVIFLFPVIGFLVYPFLLSVYNSQSLSLTEIAAFYSCIMPLFYTLFKVTKFIPEFFYYTNLELASDSNINDSELSEEEKHKIKTENKVLREHLVNHELNELDRKIPFPFIDGELYVCFLDTKESREAWFNIFVEINNSTPEIIKNEIFKYAHRFCKLLCESKVETNTFVLSFHIRVATQLSRNMFFRITRGELEKMFHGGRNDPQDMGGLKNILFDELFRS